MIKKMVTFLGRSKSWSIDHNRLNGSIGCYHHKMADEISIISKNSEKSFADEEVTFSETPEEWRLRKRSHWIIYVTVFIMTIGFSLALTGIWPYLQLLDPSLEKTSLGWVVAANPLGQLIASPIVGYLGNKLGSIRIICYFTLTFFIIGNIIYSFLPGMRDYWPHSAYHIMIISRLIVGVSSSNITLCRYYLTLSTTVKERTSSIAILSAAQSLGFIVGPAFQMILVLSIDKEILKYRSGGWLSAIFGTINLCLMAPYIFQEFNIQKLENEAKASKGGEPDEALQKPSKPDVISVVGILVSYFFSMLIFIFMETLSVPLLTDQYAFKNGTAVVVVGVFTLISGVIAVGMIIIIRKVIRKFDERKVLLFAGLVPITLGTFLYMPIYTDLPITIANCTVIEQTCNFSQQSKNLELSFNYQINEPTWFAKLNGTTYDNSLQCYNGTTETCTPGCPESQDWCNTVSKIPYSQFILGNILVIIGFPVMVALSISLYSKAVGQRPQGLWMALLAAILSVARVIGPILASYVYTKLGTVVSFGILTGGMIIGLISYIAVNRRLPSTINT